MVAHRFTADDARAPVCPEVRTGSHLGIHADVDRASNTSARTQASNGRCHTLATITAAELLTSTPISAYAQPERGPLSCELGAGHDSDHVALLATAQGGDQWWWLRWDGRPSEVTEVIQIDPCDVELPHGRYADACFLPDGHPGPHTFDLPLNRHC